MNFMPGSGFYQEISSSPNYPSSYQPYSSSAVAAENSDEGTSAAPPIEREHMFDKVVTPSDVGKLNRLVIPKQHAEKYFPLDSSAHEKGLLLNFEDRNGKPWRFRYSYWNSSQSYVMTKGWSRFVKEKKLDAGDIVSFQRGVGESAKDRLFIDWRRRPDAPEIHPSLPSFPIRPWNSLYIPPPPSRSDFSRFFHPSSASYYTQAHPPPAPPYGGGSNYGYSHRVVNGNPCATGSIVYLSSVAGMEAFNTQLRAATAVPAQPEIGSGREAVFNAVPIVQGKAAAKRLRLFGVNMDCPISDSEDCDEMASSNSTIPLSLAAPEDYPSPSSSAPRHGRDKGKSSMSLDLDI